MKCIDCDDGPCTMNCGPVIEISPHARRRAREMGFRCIEDEMERKQPNPPKSTPRGSPQIDESVSQGVIVTPPEKGTVRRLKRDDVSSDDTDWQFSGVLRTLENGRKRDDNGKKAGETG